MLKDVCQKLVELHRRYDNAANGIVSRDEYVSDLSTSGWTEEDSAEYARLFDEVEALITE